MAKKKKKKITPKKIGLTGGIASGKSTVSAYLAQHGIQVLDMDAIGRELTDESSTIVKQISKIVGQKVVPNEGLDREAVRRAIFKEPKLKKDLENLMHPLIRREFEDRCDAAFEEGHHLVICEAALLIESGHYKDLDELIVVLAPVEERKRRLIERDGIDEALAEQMMSAQVDDDTRLELATVVLHNDGDKKSLYKQVDPILKQWRKDGLI